MKKILFCYLLLLIAGKAAAQTLYFPPATGDSWETVSPESLGWCPDKIDTLISYLGQHHTKAFILLKDGKIAIEHYYGTFTADSAWLWNSAGKSLAAFITGLAQQDGMLQISDSLPRYLGHGFSSCSAAEEDDIRIRNQLTMTTGFDDMHGGGGSGTESHCTDDTCLVCIAAPGTRWAYHNAPYTLLHWVIDSATHQSMNMYTHNRLTTSCGITGLWLSGFPGNPYDEIFASKARSMARFGLLMLAGGRWGNTTVMSDTAYFRQMTQTSQSINLSYGYLWWLNGKASYHIPGAQLQLNGPLSPHAPADMFSALGKNSQLLNVIPSMNLVMVRMGDAFDTTDQLEISNQVNDSIWLRLNAVFCNTTAIKAPGNIPALRIFPNPARDNLSIELPGTVFDVLWSDVLGRQTHAYPGNKGTAGIDCSAMQPGIYFVRIITDKQQVYTTRILIER